MAATVTGLQEVGFPWDQHKQEDCKESKHKPKVQMKGWLELTELLAELTSAVWGCSEGGDSAQRQPGADRLRLRGSFQLRPLPTTCVMGLIIPPCRIIVEVR